MLLQRLPGIVRSAGCTEPGAIAFAAALAGRALGRPPERVAVACDRSTLKNAWSAGVPGAGGRIGPAIAAALGALGGDPARGLAALSAVGGATSAAAAALVDAGAVSVALRDDAPPPWIEVELTGGGRSARARIEGAHTRVVGLWVDGAPRPVPTVAAAPPVLAGAPADLAAALRAAEAIDADDAAALLEGAATNLAAARAGLALGAPPPEPDADAALEAERLAEAASYARMSGAPVEVVTSGWSGNQGLVATVPVAILATRLGRDEDALARALATSHAVGHVLRAATGALSPLCNALLAAAAGAAVACARLEGGDDAAAARACRLVLGGAAGALCDGAKPGCALKVGLAAGLAVRTGRRAAAGGPVPGGGLVREDLAATLAGFARLAEALAPADRAVLDAIRAPLA